jgi:fructosamine-3-kinase
MSALTPALKSALEEKLVTRIVGSEALGGGMVNTAARVETSDGTTFVKWKTETPARFFEMEADGLERLASADALRVPKVLAFQDRQDDDTPAFLALEWIEERQSSSPERFKQGFAEGLAALHRNTPSPFGQFGLEYDNYLGAQPQKNTPTANWATFYRDYRIAVQRDVARANGLLPPARERAVNRVMGKAEEILTGLDPKPVLIHGDLWNGNFLTAGDKAVLIDPAIYYADREVEMAYVELFGTFLPGFFAAYNSAYPLQVGYDYRRPLHQLYPLLVHVNHFGEEYGPAVDSVCRFYLG